jgi:hypothetical protein
MPSLDNPSEFPFVNCPRSGNVALKSTVPDREGAEGVAATSPPPLVVVVFPPLPNFAVPPLPPVVPLPPLLPQAASVARRINIEIRVKPNLSLMDFSLFKKRAACD